MKPGVLFELKNIGKPLAWIKNVKFIYTRDHQTNKPQELTQEVECLIWKPELFEPKVRKP